MLSGDSFLDMTHKFMPYKYFDSIWPEAPNGPIEGNVWSELTYDYSATYSPNPDNPPFYVDLPVAWPSGELIQEVWDRWLAFDPVVNVHDRLDNLRKLSGILLDAGSNDDYNLHWGHRLLSHHLDEAGIAHEHTENPGNHGGRANERYQVALEWLGDVLDADGSADVDNQPDGYRIELIDPSGNQPPTSSRTLGKLHGDLEASHLLRPTAGHRDLSRPQPRRLLVGHIHDGEAAEVLLGLDVRTVGEQRRAARRIDTEHGGSVVQAAGEDEDPGSLHLCQQRPDSLGLLAQLLVRVVGHPLVVESDEVLGHVSSFAGVAPAATLHLLHERRQPDST